MTKLRHREIKQTTLGHTTGGGVFKPLLFTHTLYYIPMEYSTEMTHSCCYCLRNFLSAFPCFVNGALPYLLIHMFKVGIKTPTLQNKGTEVQKVNEQLAQFTE